MQREELREGMCQEKEKREKRKEKRIIIDQSERFREMMKRTKLKLSVLSFCWRP